MSTGAACERCAELRVGRRQRRARGAEQVRAELPDADFQARRLAVEQRLREVVTADLARDERRRWQAAAAEAARTAAGRRALAEAEAAEQARWAWPCRRCGVPEAGGLCGVCRARDETEMLLRQAVAAVVAGCGGAYGPGQAAVLADEAEAVMRAGIRQARARARADGATEVVAAVAGRLAAELLLREQRTAALRNLAHGPEAEAEAEQARAMQLHRRHLHPSPAAAKETAETAAREARQRVAEHLLTTRAKAWLAARTPAPAEESAPYGRAAVCAAGAARARAALTRFSAAPGASLGRRRRAAGWMSLRPPRAVRDCRDMTDAADLLKGDAHRAEAHSNGAGLTSRLQALPYDEPESDRRGGDPRMGDISINSHVVRATGSDMSALSREVARKLNNSLEESQATGVADSVWGWECAQHLYSCAQTWEEHMVGLAKKMGELGERLQESAGSYDAQDEEAASRLRHGLNDLGKA